VVVDVAVVDYEMNVVVVAVAVVVLVAKIKRINI